MSTEGCASECLERKVFLDTGHEVSWLECLRERLRGVQINVCQFVHAVMGYSFDSCPHGGRNNLVCGHRGWELPDDHPFIETMLYFYGSRGVARFREWDFQQFDTNTKADGNHHFFSRVLEDGIENRPEMKHSTDDPLAIINNCEQVQVNMADRYERIKQRLIRKVDRHLQQLAA